MKLFAYILFVLLIMFCNKICSAVTFKVDSLGLYVIKDVQTIIIDSAQYDLITTPPDSTLKNNCSIDADSIKCKCLKGKLDAKMYHGNTGVYYILGFVSTLIPSGLIIETVLVLMSKNTPATGRKTLIMSSNKDLFNDPIYLKCYNKRVKWQAIKMELLGTATATAAIIGLVFILMGN